MRLDLDLSRMFYSMAKSRDREKESELDASELHKRCQYFAITDQNEV